MTGLTSDIINFLNELFIDPKCELNYNTDYELLIATMLSAQTTDKRVNQVTEILFTKYKNLKELSEANLDDVIKIVKPLGTYNKKSQNVIIIAKKLYEECNGIVPNNRDYLESLPGVGRKTTNVVLSNIYNIPCIAVDTHVSRVSKRLGIADKNDVPYEIEKKLNKLFNDKALSKLHHQLVLFGRYYCTAKKPKCNNCKLKKYCKEVENE